MSMHVSTLSFGIGYPLPLQSPNNSSLMLVTTQPAKMVAWNLIYKKRSHTEEILRRMSTPSLLVICSSVSLYIAEVQCCLRPLRMRSSPVSCGEKLRHLVAKEYRNCWMESWRDVVEGGGGWGFVAQRDLAFPSRLWRQYILVSMKSHIESQLNISMCSLCGTRQS